MSDPAAKATTTSSGFTFDPSKAKAQSPASAPLKVSPDFKHTKAPGTERDEDEQDASHSHKLIIVGVFIFVFLTALGTGLFLWKGQKVLMQNEANAQERWNQKKEQIDKIADIQASTAKHNTEALKKHVAHQRRLLAIRQEAAKRQAKREEALEIARVQVETSEKQWKTKLDQMKQEAEKEKDSKAKEKLLMKMKAEEGKKLAEENKLKEKLAKAEVDVAKGASAIAKQDAEDAKETQKD